MKYTLDYTNLHAYLRKKKYVFNLEKINVLNFLLIFQIETCAQP